MRDLQSKLARETNRLTGLFERRYEMTVVTDEGAGLSRCLADWSICWF